MTETTETFESFEDHQDCHRTGYEDPDIFDGVLYWWCDDHKVAIPREWGIERRDRASRNAVRQIMRALEAAKDQWELDCWRCIEDAGQTPQRMVVCSECGNKRCPKATDHRLDCTNSNEPGQPGSAYEHGSGAATVRRMVGPDEALALLDEALPDRKVLLDKDFPCPECRSVGGHKMDCSERWRHG